MASSRPKWKILCDVTTKLIPCDITTTNFPILDTKNFQEPPNDEQGFANQFVKPVRETCSLVRQLFCRTPNPVAIDSNNSCTQVEVKSVRLVSCSSSTIASKLFKLMHSCITVHKKEQLEALSSNISKVRRYPYDCCLSFVA